MGQKVEAGRQAVGTIFLVHFLDLPSIPPPLDDIEVKFIPDEIKTQSQTKRIGKASCIPESQCCQFWSRELSKRTEVQPINGAPNYIE
jgi:hypothetical protein